MSNQFNRPNYFAHQYIIEWMSLIGALSLERFSSYYELVELPYLLVKNPAVLNSIARSYTLSTYQIGQRKSVADFFRELEEGYDRATSQAFYDWAVRYDVEPSWQRILGEWVSPFASFRSKSKNLEGLNFKAELIDQISSVVQKYDAIYGNIESYWLSELYYRAEIEGRLNQYLLENQQPPLSEWELKLTELVQGSIGDDDIPFPISAALMRLLNIATNHRIFQIWQELDQLLTQDQQTQLLAWGKTLLKEKGWNPESLKLPLAEGVYPGEYRWE